MWRCRCRPGWCGTSGGGAAARRGVCGPRSPSRYRRCARCADHGAVEDCGRRGGRGRRPHHHRGRAGHGRVLAGRVCRVRRVRHRDAARRAGAGARRWGSMRPAGAGHGSRSTPTPGSASRSPTAGSAPRGALLYPRFSREELGGRFLGLMAYLDPKGEGDKSMPGNQRPGPGVWDGALGDPRDMAKAGLLESQSPEDGSSHPPERRLKPAPRSARPMCNGRCNLRGAERCPVRAFKEMSGTPTSRCHVRQGRTWDRLRGASPMATEAP